MPLVLKNNFKNVFNIENLDIFKKNEKLTISYLFLFIYICIKGKSSLSKGERV